jgi:hypothetical protein
VRRVLTWVGLLSTPHDEETRLREPPAPDAGPPRPAGAGVSDADIADQVGDQTSRDLEAEDVFSREKDGAATDTEAAKADGSELT